MTAVHCYAQRLNQGTIAHGDVSWELEAAFCRHAVVGSERSVVRRCGGEAHSPAEVVTAVATMIAGVAGYAGLESDSVSNGEALNSASALYNDSCRLVA